MRKVFVLIVVLLGLGIASCNRETASGEAGGEGSMSLSLRLESATKAAMTESELLSSAIVNIYYADYGGLVRSYSYQSLPETIYLPADSYRVDVAAGEIVKDDARAASWEQKSYKGSSTFDVKAGVTTDVQVVARVSDVVTKISFDSSVAENFVDGYTFTIGLGEADGENYLVYDASKSGAEGYFLIDGLDEPELKWNFSGKLVKDGSAFSKSGVIESVETGKAYAMTLRYSIKDGELSLELLVDYSTDVIDDMIVFEPASTALASSSMYEIWAGHATIHADVDEKDYPDPAKVKFSYSSDGVSWTTVDALRASEGKYEATLAGLAPSTEYTYKLLIDGVEMGSKTLTTESAPNVPNHSFEYVSTVSGNSYYKWYDPNCGTTDGSEKFWGSGNGEKGEAGGVAGSASMGITITYVDESDKVDGERSVRAQSGSILGMLAAGNIFTGNFSGLVGTSGGKVSFGRPWTSRPTAVSFWIKYTASQINILSDSCPSEAGIVKNSSYDRCRVAIALGTWNYKTYGGDKNCPILCNTTDESTFVDYYTDPSTIANGEIILFGNGKQKINGGSEETVDNAVWRKVTIPLIYHDTNTYPTHIVIMGASSMYGDYFTGSDDAKMWLDDVHLIYE